MKRTNNALFCDKCSLQFDKKIVYDIHLSFVHKISDKVETEEKEIENMKEDAVSVFQSDTAKPNQNLVSIEERNKSLKCSMCEYTSKNKEYLNQHIKSVHEEKKPHKCSICDYFTSHEGNLKKHIESIHKGEKPHKCSICNYSFSKKRTMNIHIKSVHEEKKPHQCSICDHSFSAKQILSRQRD